jgi:hypothetical protein
MHLQKNRAGVLKASYKFNTIILKSGGPYRNLTLELSLFSSVRVSLDNAKTNAKLHHKIDCVNAPSNKNRAGVYKASYQFNRIILKARGSYRNLTLELSLFSSVSISSGNAKTNAKLYHKIDLHQIKIGQEFIKCLTNLIGSF